MKILFILSLVIFSFGAFSGEYRFTQERFKLTFIQNDSVHQTLKIQGSLIISKGEHEEELLKVLSAKLKSGLNTHIILDLFGGDIALVNKVYSIIQRTCHSNRYSSCEITTEIEMFRHCASACIPLFMVGDKRIAAERSKWGFHQAALIEGFLKIPFMAEYVLRSKGVNSAWLKRNKQIFKSLKMSWLKPYELNGSSIITHIISHPN